MLIIYHGDCPDGWCAAWVALGRYPDATLYPAAYQEPPPDVTGQDVLIVDFSYPRAVLEDMHAQAASLLVLDHHVTAAEDLFGLDYAIFDMRRSGAGLAWRELRGPGAGDDGPAPWLVRYVEDRDLWRRVLPNTDEVSAYIGTLAHERAVWDAHDGPLVPAHVVEHGRTVLAGRAHYVAETITQAERGELGGLEIPVVNAPKFCVSEVLSELCAGHPFAAAWRRLASGHYKYSLRSRDGYDVSAVARQYGGGGHRAAAGFRSARLEHLAGA